MHHLRGLSVMQLKAKIEVLDTENKRLLRELHQHRRDKQPGPRASMGAVVDTFGMSDREELLEEIYRLRCIIYATPR